jgi:hypothetical protein
MDYDPRQHRAHVFRYRKICHDPAPRPRLCERINSTSERPSQWQG